MSNVYNNTSDKIIWRGTVYWNGSDYQNARELATSATTSYWEWDPCNYVISYDANG